MGGAVSYNSRRFNGWHRHTHCHRGAASGSRAASGRRRTGNLEHSPTSWLIQTPTLDWKARRHLRTSQDLHGGLRNFHNRLSTFCSVCKPRLPPKPQHRNFNNVSHCTLRCHHENSLCCKPFVDTNRRHVSLRRKPQEHLHRVWNNQHLAVVTSLLEINFKTRVKKTEVRPVENVFA